MDADPEVAPITERTKTRWPRKEILTDYLVEFGQKQVDAGVISFQTTVKLIKRAEPTDGRTTQFTLELEQRSGEQSTVSCETVVMATGLAVPVMPSMRGVEHAELYLLRGNGNYVIQIHQFTPVFWSIF